MEKSLKNSECFGRSVGGLNLHLHFETMAKSVRYTPDIVYCSPRPVVKGSSDLKKSNSSDTEYKPLLKNQRSYTDRRFGCCLSTIVEEDEVDEER
eukprot:CAMPEP_0182446254 /NCGR_PEP_ID=MMETSP1172-20130603/4091_1 /TAXON_ID=708627 /ORGANISM="Timspurckia oligopyrenoides, Strain CCMP3278" /LENGTH=94 /DNA_ID=CAMNT_0024642159 /DNA_START=453 /DNA_END=737 /DNA_ORIENTATION=+